LLFLHGWGASLASFNDLSAHFAKKYRVVRLDFPGFGSSPKPDDSWGVGEYSDLVSACIKKLKLDDIYAVIGHSFGGRVIIKGVAANTIAASHIVLLDAAGVKPPQTLKKSLYKSVAKVGKVTTSLPGLKALRPMLRKNLYQAAGATDYLNAQAMKQIFLNTINEDLLPDVHKLTQPTLLIWGENDTETSVADAYKMMNELDDAQLVVVSDAGHFVFVDDKARVVKEIETFLS
jgi:pimeloyl-ACP methyl ester carboxylesterase